MKSSPKFTLAFRLLPVLCLLLACKPAEHEEEAKPVTEVPVQAGKVVKATLRSYVDAYGYVEPAVAGGAKAAGAARLAAPAAGIVLAVPVREGDKVEVGTVVVRLDDRQAQASFRLAEQQLERQKKLFAAEGTSIKALQEAGQQLAVAQAQLAAVQLTSPLAGLVARINVHPGQAVDLTTVVAEIVDPTRLVVTLSVPAEEAAHLQVGQMAFLFVHDEAKADAQGAVTFVSPQVDPTSGTVLVRLSVPGSSGLRQGEFTHAKVVQASHADVLAVPLAAVYTDGEGVSTLSVIEANVAKQMVVKVGLREGDLIEVSAAGLAEGATVVTVGSYGLPKETKVLVLNPVK